jgi:hypothetical protein
MTHAEYTAIAGRLREAAGWLSSDIPAGTRVPQFLEGDVKLDELDAYAVEVMGDAANALDALEDDLAALEQRALELEEENGRLCEIIRALQGVR